MHILKITGKSYKNFPEITYKVGSGRLYGRSGEGKSNMLSTVTACFVNCDMDGHKLVPLPDDAQTGWVKIEYEENGEFHEAYRTWTRSDSGFTSASSLTKKIDKSLFLAIANPMYVFGLDNSERIDFLIDVAYCNYKGNIIDELSGDVPVEIMDFAKHFKDGITLPQLRNLAKKTRLDMKANKKQHETLDAQLLILEQVENSFEIVNELSAQVIALESQIQKQEEIIRVIDSINSLLLKNAIELIAPAFFITSFTDDGKILCSGVPADRLSSGEKLECGLDIANALAGRCDIVPPTLIDDATARGHKDIDMTPFANLTQIITTAYADVDTLCEYHNGMLHGLDKSWKKPADTTFRPEVCIEMIPYDS